MNRSFLEAVCVLLCAVAGASAGVKYDVIDLGSGVATALNDKGDVVGYVGSWSDWWHWSEATGRRIMPDSSTYPYNHYARDVNNHGIVVGNWDYSLYDWQAGVWRQADASFVYDLNTDQYLYVSSGTDGLYGVNNLGAAVGKDWVRSTASGKVYYQSIVYDVGTAMITVVYGSDSQGWGISDHGATVGGQNGNRYAWANAGVGGYTLDGPPQDDGDRRACAYDVNDQYPDIVGGMVVGSGRYVGHEWNQSGPVYWDNSNTAHEIGGLGTTASGAARAVNNSRQIVGWSHTGVEYHGFIYQNGVLRDLNDVLTTTGVTVNYAYDINEKGQIVGTAGNTAVLLDPVYFSDGDFQLGDLTVHWSVSGPGSAATRELGAGEFCAALTAGSPVTIAQEVATPDAAFELQFDYQFLTADPTAVLRVEMAGTQLAEFHAPDPLMASFDTHAVLVGDPALRGLDTGTLSFTYDGPTGTELLLDNVTITQVPQPAALWLLALGGVTLLPCLVCRRSPPHRSCLP